jgi:hypothetical protein
VVEVPVGPPEHIDAGHRLGNDIAGPQIVVATGVAAKAPASATRTFWTGASCPRSGRSPGR